MAESSGRGHTDDARTADVSTDLVSDSLRALVPTTTVVTWMWTSATILLVESRVIHGLAVLGLVLTSGAVSYVLHRRHLRLAVSLYLCGLALAVTTVAIAFPGVATLYLYIPVVLIAATLTGPSTAWAIALGSMGLVLTVGRGTLAGRASGLASPLILIFLTALTSWLSSRRLFTALAWALSMTEQAQRNAQDARERRAEVRSILKSLEEAYVRLERANQALIFAREAAEEAYRFKAEFVANVSHELRTPLNLIVGFSEMMAMSPESYKGVALPGEYRGDVMAIYHSARHLSDLINDVLDLSQIEAGRLPLDRRLADLREIIGEAVEIVRGLAQAKGLQLQVELPDALPLLRLDQTRMRQVLLNLLTNATRFTDKGWIRVRAWIEGQEARVSVADSGRGIAHDKIARAFEAFSQLTEERARDGSGLGLAVSRRFVELHGGGMWIESVLGRGTTVGFALPLPESGKDSPPAPLHRAVPPVPADEGLPVLVLNDDPGALALLQRYTEGCRFVPASSASQVRAILEANKVAAVLLDAGADGLDRQLVEAALPPGVPVLSCPLPSQRRLGMQLGATDLLPKPITRDDLLRVLARLPAVPQKVLVIDDDLGVIRLLSRMLEAAYPHLQVLEAANGREGWQALHSERPDVILLDLLMPVMDGRAFLAALAQDAELAATPVIIMSAHVEATAGRLEGEISLKRGGGFTPTEVVQAIQALLNTTRCLLVPQT